MLEQLANLVGVIEVVEHADHTAKKFFLELIDAQLQDWVVRLDPTQVLENVCSYEERIGVADEDALHRLSVLNDVVQTAGELVYVHELYFREEPFHDVELCVHLKRVALHRLQKKGYHAVVIFQNDLAVANHDSLCYVDPLTGQGFIEQQDDELNPLLVQFLHAFELVYDLEHKVNLLVVQNDGNAAI